MLEAYFQEAGFTPEEVAMIARRFESRSLAKGDFLVKEQSVSRSVAFLEEGLMQFYSMDAEGLERTTYVSLPRTFVASLLSFLEEKPARENIRAIVPSVVHLLHKSDIVELKREVPGFADWYLGILEYQLCCIDEDRIDLITLTAEERYEKLLKKEPEVLRTVPLHYIASMLGMSPRHLSRLRAKG